MDNTEIVKSYNATRSAVLSAMRDISKLVYKHGDLQYESGLTWAHVGDLDKVAQDLEEIYEFMNSATSKK